MIVLVVQLLESHVVVSICHVPVVIIVDPELRWTAGALVLVGGCTHQVARRAHLMARNLTLVLLKSNHGIPVPIGRQRVVELAVIRLPKHQIMIIDEWIVQIAASSVLFALHFHLSFTESGVVSLLKLLAPPRQVVHGVSLPELAVATIAIIRLAVPQRIVL